jgi:hypothetical protein
LQVFKTNLLSDATRPPSSGHWTVFWFLSKIRITHCAFAIAWVQL